ncbi:MAG: MoaD/ThiS family protein [Candidatus Bathyarchaeota archaeon]|nr:MAG: MoaD/ThiS family protein [Candidatus Bathyarchaeota archaeon]
MTISIEVRFLGILRKLAKRDTVIIRFRKPAIRVNDVLAKISSSFPQDFNQALIDPELHDPRPNVLILLNNTEINVLNGLKTKIKDGDKIVFIPVFHGG